MIEIDSPKKINEILENHTRLKMLIKSIYKLYLEDILSVTIDKEGKTISVNTVSAKYKFKMKSADNVLSPSDEDPSVMQFNYDPALYKNIDDIIKTHDK